MLRERLLACLPNQPEALAQALALAGRDTDESALGQADQSRKHSRKHPKLAPRAHGDRARQRGVSNGHRQRIASLHAELAIPPVMVCTSHLSCDLS